jgi:hypothetical protein
MTGVLEAYIDETEFVLNGHKRLIYGAVIPHDLPAALDGLTDLKTTFGLSSDLEVKWSSRGGDPDVKAALKEEAISLVGRLFTGLFVVWASSDKDEAFLRLASLVRSYAARGDVPYVHLLHDHDAFRSRQRVVASLASWEPPRCTLLADVESQLSLPMQFADLAVGAFGYLVRCRLGLASPRTTIFEWEPGHTEELPLDKVFGVLLRWMIPGKTPALDPEVESYLPDSFMKSCVGVGVIVDDRFDSEAKASIAEAATFYVGCMS